MTYYATEEEVKRGPGLASGPRAAFEEPVVGAMAHKTTDTWVLHPGKRVFEICPECEGSVEIRRRVAYHQHHQHHPARCTLCPWAGNYVTSEGLPT